jgi:hypothetical protein
MATPDKISKNNLPPDSEWLFPEYKFGEMGVESHYSVIIERILERGSWEQVRWLFATYGEPQVAAWVRAHGFRLLSKRSFAFWRLVLGISDFQAPPWAQEAKAGAPW